MIVTRAHHEEVVAVLRQQIADLQVERETLLDRYHELRLQGAASPPAAVPPPKSPLAQLGPKTQTALREMSVGLGRSNRKAMEDVALRLHTIDKLSDEQIAQLVLRGESLSNGNGSG